MEKKKLPAYMQEMGVEAQNHGCHLLVLCWRTGEIYRVRDNGSG
jgi:hypothetical protein